MGYRDYRVEEIRERINIVELVGRYVELRRDGRNFKGLCPFHPEKTPSFKVNEAKNAWMCFGCGAGGDGIRFVMEIEGKNFLDAVSMLAELYGIHGSNYEVAQKIAAKKRELRRQQERLAAEDARRRTNFVFDIIECSQPPEPGCPVERYIERRGLRLLTAGWPTSLRRAVLKHPEDGKRYPVMLGIVTDATGNTIGLHRTYLTEDGRKAPVSPVKLSLGPISGGAVRLGVDSEHIIIAEGIESALGAAMAFGLVPWAALSAVNMPKIQIPPSVQSVTICADADRSEVGEKAAEKLRSSIKQQQVQQQRLIEVRIRLPRRGRSDFADFG